MFRFTIRELLLFTLVVALAVGWWIDRSQLVAGFAAAKNRELEAADGKTYALEAVLANEGFKVKWAGSRVHVSHPRRGDDNFPIEMAPKRIR